MLYDYESKDVCRKNLKIMNSCYISRSREVEQLPDPSNDSLLGLTLDSGHLSISSVSYPLWQVIRNPRHIPTPKFFSLKQGTVIKLGRLQFEVKALKNKEDLLEDVEASRIKDSTQICRVCFVEDLPDNPLVSICKCSGSIQCIHVKCLQSWILSKVTTNGENPLMKYLRSIHCELCREKLPFILKVEGKLFDMLQGHKLEVPYLILEGIQSEQREPGVYFISFAQKESVMLGRGHDSDVRIPDISVSRCHAKISFRENEFVIEDNNSKFGTLVKLPSPFVVESRITVQCGRTVVEFSKNCPAKDEKFEWEVDG